MTTGNCLRRMFLDPPWRCAAALGPYASVALAAVLVLFCPLSTLPSPRALLAATVALALTANIASTLATHPHTLSYFNEIAGGPMHGPAHLLDANVDWGHDLLFLRMWCEAHPEARPFHFAWFGFISPRLAGIEYDRVPRASVMAVTDNEHCAAFTSEKGIYAVSISELYGYMHLGRRNDRFAPLRAIKPAGIVAYSLVIYSVVPST